MRATVEGKRNSPVGNWSRNCPFENSIVFLWVEENNRFSLMMAVFESNAFQRLFLFGKFWKEESFIISLLRNYSRWNWISIRNSVFRTIIPIIYFFKERKLYRIRIDKFFPKFNIPFKKRKLAIRTRFSYNPRYIDLSFQIFQNATQRTPVIRTNYPWIINATSLACPRN